MVKSSHVEHESPNFSNISVAGYKVFKEKSRKNKHSDAEKFVLTNVHALHMGRRCYTPDFAIVDFLNEAFLPSYHQGSFAGIKDVSFHCVAKI